MDVDTGKVTFRVQHTYQDDGAAPGNGTSSDTSTIQVTVTDDDTGEGVDTETVLVKNVAPTVILTAVAEINENGTATLTGTYTDPGLLDAHGLVVDWNDPNDPRDSTFAIPALRDAAGVPTLAVGDTFSSSTDMAVLTITSIESIGGSVFVGFRVQHQYRDDGVAPGNGIERAKHADQQHRQFIGLALRVERDTSGLEARQGRLAGPDDRGQPPRLEAQGLGRP